MRAETAERLGDAALRRLTDAFFSRPLPRDRPLWELRVVPRLAGRRAAILGKVHHAMVDGIAAVQLGLLPFDVEPSVPATDPVAWEPRAVTPVALAVDAARDSALAQFRTMGQAARLGLSPGRGVSLAGTLRRATLSLTEDIRRPAPSSFLNAEIGPRRRLISTTLPLPKLVGIKERTQTKLNDVVLAVVAGALSRLAAAHGEPPHDVRAMVPANVRGDGGGAQGNAISFLFVDLPVASAGPAERVRVIHERTRRLKETGRIASSDELLGLLERLPAPLQGQAARMAAGPRMYNLTVSNVPGPPVPLYVAGARVSSIVPVIPIPDRHALAIGALSYERRLHLSAYLDPAALPHAGRLPVQVADACEELSIATLRPRAA